MHRLKEPLKLTFYHTDSGSAGGRQLTATPAACGTGLLVSKAAGGLPACRSSQSRQRTDGVNCPSQLVGTLRRRWLAFVGQTGSYSPSYDVYLANPNGSNPRLFYADVGKQHHQPPAGVITGPTNAMLGAFGGERRGPFFCAGDHPGCHLRHRRIAGRKCRHGSVRRRVGVDIQNRRQPLAKLS